MAGFNTLEAKQVTLTFDNGPVAGVTDRILRILDDAQLHTTFFMIGENLATPSQRDLMREVRQAGHWVGNHTTSHTLALGDKPDAAYARHEIEVAQHLIGDCASPEKWFRPYGNDGLLGAHLLSRAAVEHLLQGRYSTVIWNSVPGDWWDADGWVDRCMSQIRAEARPVVVLHDIPGACLERLPELLTRLSDEGVTFSQRFPDSVVLTRDGRPISLKPEFIADMPGDAEQER